MISIPGGQSKNLSSPFYPWKYPEPVDCSYIIDAGEGNNVLVDFVDVDFQIATLTLDDDVFLVFLNEVEFPNLYISKNRTMMILYESAFSAEYRGKFLLSLTSVYLPGM